MIFGRAILSLTISLTLVFWGWADLAIASPIRITALSGTDLPEWAGVKVQRSPNDPLFANQRYLIQSNAVKAWDITTGSEITVAIIDTGASIHHEDIAPKLWVNSDEIPNNHSDDDGNGYVDDVNGYNFYQNNTDLTDGNGHGTGVASIIAAQTNNGIGMAGVNWRAKVMVLKALNSLGGGEYTHVARAIRYAAENGAQVINMSFGTYIDNQDLRQAVDYAVSKGVVIVAASGNNGLDKLLYPAAYPHVISVGAVDTSGYRASFSNYGTGLDVMAPGISVLGASRENNSAYSTSSGTSYAAAQVTGLASLVLSRHPSYSPAQIESAIKNAAIREGNLAEYGYGLIDMAATLGAASTSRSVSANISVSTFNVPADGESYSTVSVTVKEGSAAASGHKIYVRTEGGQVKLNDLTVNNEEVFIGNTNSRGVVSFQIRSHLAGVKKLFITDITSAAELGDVEIRFSSTGPTSYRAEWVAQSPDLTLDVGSQATLWVELKNTGNVPWQGAASSERGQFRLGTFRPADRVSSFRASNWISPNRVSTLDQGVVNPGQTGRISFTIVASRPGVFSEYFNPVIEYEAWLPDVGIHWNITVLGNELDVSPASYSAELISRSNDVSVEAGGTAFVSTTLKNTGSAAWWGTDSSERGAVRLGTARELDRASKFYSNSWVSPNRAIGAGFKVNPGGRLTLGFTIQAPNEPGVYYESFRLVSEYVAWFGPVVTWKITVT